jgi:molecular chaperone GrpE
MVKDEFWGAFEKLGLEEVPGVGSLFNPNIHEALTTMPVMDPVLNDTIVQVYTTGYRINDTVIRASQVIVGKYTAPPKTETSESSENSETSEANVSEDSSDS